MCSLRSCPTQNARPVPVSTTQRTASSDRASRTASRSATLVATSRLFIASGRFRVIVATPSVTSYRTGCCSVMDGLQSAGGRGRAGQARVDEAGRGGEQPRGLLREEGSRLVADPVGRQQLGGQARVGEQELAPLVDEHEADGERLLVLRGVGQADELRRRVVEELLREPPPVDVRLGESHQVPRLAGPQAGSVVVGPEAREAGVLRVEELAGLGGGERADPGAVRERRVAEEREAGAHPLADRAVRDRLEHQQVPVAVPGRVAGAVDPAPRRRRGAAAPARSGRSRVLRSAAPVRASPAGPSARRPCGRPERRCRGGRAAGPGRPPGPGRDGPAGGRRRGRRARTGRAPGRVCRTSFVGLAVARPNMGDNDRGTEQAPQSQAHRTGRGVRWRR